jgi:hypothetical protein
MNQPVQVPVRRDVDRAVFEAQIRAAARPVVIEGLVRDWPIVQAARQSRLELARHIKTYDAGRRPHVIEAPPEAQGRIFYRDDLARSTSRDGRRAWVKRSTACSTAPAPPRRRRSSWRPWRRRPIYRGSRASIPCRCWIPAWNRVSGSAMRSR